MLVNVTRLVLGGPLLFIIYINDIDDCVAGKILKFAYDIKRYRTVYSDEDVSALCKDVLVRLRSLLLTADVSNTANNANTANRHRRCQQAICVGLSCLSLYRRSVCKIVSATTANHCMRCRFSSCFRNIRAYSGTNDRCPEGVTKRPHSLTRRWQKLSFAGVGLGLGG